MKKSSLAVTQGGVSRFSVDSDASKHMCKDSEPSTNMTPTKAVIVLGDGTDLRAGYKGDVEVPLVCGICTLRMCCMSPLLH